MEQTGRSRAATFIVRLWVEDGEKPEHTWRGQIEHVQSSEKRYVHQMAQVITFIEEHFGDKAPDTRHSGIR
jgi:hypothetical protein